MYAPPLARLIEALTKLPTIGPKTAQRLAYHILRLAPEDAEALAQAIIEARALTRYCSICWNLTDVDRGLNEGYNQLGIDQFGAAHVAISTTLLYVAAT